MAKLAAKAAGNEFSDAGVAKTFSNILLGFDINPAQLKIIDASGLSRQNKVTAHVLAQLLPINRKPACGWGKWHAA